MNGKTWEEKLLKPDAEDTEEEIAPDGYAAFTLSPRASRVLPMLEVHYSAEHVEQYDLSGHVRTIMNKPDELLLVFPIGALRLTGRNLRGLLYHLRKRRIETLTVFDGNIHPRQGPQAVVITKAEWQEPKAR